MGVWARRDPSGCFVLVSFAALLEIELSCARRVAAIHGGFHVSADVWLVAA